MNEFNDQTLADHNEAALVMGEDFTLNGKNVRGIFSEVTQTLEAVDAGFLQTASATVTITTGQLVGATGGIRQAQGMNIVRVADGKAYRIGNDIIDNGAGLIDLPLINPMQGD